MNEKIIEVNNYDGIFVDEYEGKYGKTYSLLAMQKGQNDVWYKRWCFLSRFKKGDTEPTPSEKKMPMAVRLGDKETAKKIIKEIWEAIK